MPCKDLGVEGEALQSLSVTWHQASKEETREKSERVTPERHGTGGETEGQEGSEKRKEREGVDNRREEGTNLGANRTLLL